MRLLRHLVRHFCQWVALPMTIHILTASIRSWFKSSLFWNQVYPRFTTRATFRFIFTISVLQMNSVLKVNRSRFMSGTCIGCYIWNLSYMQPIWHAVIRCKVGSIFNGVWWHFAYLNRFIIKCRVASHI